MIGGRAVKTAVPALAALLVGVAIPPIVHAHGGGLDDRGCHRDTSAGNYHCHDGPHDGQTFPSKAAYPTGSESPPEDSDETESSRAYDRDDYGDWVDRDDDCQDTRQEVLIAESVEPVELGPDGCRVVSGRWQGPYTGETFTDPGALHVDHMVPLKEAHVSGAVDWSDRRKRRYANDLRHPEALIAVEAGANMSKGSRGPADWMPENDDYHCEYVEAWVTVKQAWGLSMDPAEAEKVQDVLSGCQNGV